MKEVLFSVGTTVDVEIREEGIGKYLIIGLRQYNPHSGKAWDYIGIPLDNGYIMNCKTDHPYDHNNLHFFNHTDIQEVI